MNITLPSDPIDLYEIEGFTVEHDEVRSIMLRYHVSRTWMEVYPEDTHQHPGASFVDEWQVFRDGDFCGRISRWDAPTASPLFERAYATAKEAYAEACRRLGRKILRLERETSECRELLEQYLLLAEDPCARITRS